MARRTTIELPDSVEKYLNLYEHIFGLKNLVIGGIVALSALEPKEREKCISIANQTETDEKSLRMKFNKIKEIINKQKVGIKILSEQESKIVKEFISEIGPDNLLNIFADLGTLSSCEKAIVDAALSAARADILNSRNKKGRKGRSTKAG